MDIPNHEVGVIIGNGLSRERIPLEPLRRLGYVVACNWIYRDFYPDVVVAIDSPTQSECLDKWGKSPPFNQLNQTIQRSHALWNKEVLCKIPFNDPPFFNNSGLFGAWFLCEHVKVKLVYMIGIDFFRPVPGRLNERGKPTNDMYNGLNTINAGVHKCWEKMTELYPDVRFVRVGWLPPTDIDFYRDELTKRIELIGDI
jgi:hypothetical protein